MAQSLKNSKKKRTVKQIFGTSSSYGRNALLLYRISSYFRPKQILELGTSIGIGSLHLHLGSPDSNFNTIEGCPETYKLACKNLEERPIQVVNKTFYDFIKQTENLTYDLIFIDGHHDGEALKYYVKLLEPFTHDETIIILDDIRWSSSMLKAWKDLKEDKKYHVSMDFFRMGILVKRPEQQKEHFVLTLKK
jgi:predicted O-methyltransferase YrrM